MRTVYFDGIAVGNLSVNFLDGPTAKVEVKAAFIDTKTGKTHGWTTCQQWSRETIDKLAELRACMERDLAEIHFVDAAVPTSGTATGSGSLSDATKGLGERLGAAQEEVPQG